MNDTVEEVKKRLDIVEFLSSFITLRKAGRNFKAVCPFHKEKTPSFVVSPDRQIWRCFGSCNEGGDVISFLMKWENITFFEALKELAEKTGVQILKVPVEDAIWKKKEQFIRMNTLAAEYFSYILFQRAEGKKTLDYLMTRKINGKIAQKFQLGYAPSSWDSLLKFLQKKKFTNEELAEGGLVVKTDTGRHYDRFRGRLIFPIKDPRGNIIAFSARSLNPEEKASKYINTPETPLYHKRESLYGIDVAREAIKEEKNVVLVEGEFDVLSSYGQGIEYVVATKGTAVTREQLQLLKRYSDRITLALDSDAAGEEAVKKTLIASEHLDLEIEVVTFDYAKDPDEAAREDPIRFKKQLKEKIPVYDFIMNIALAQNPKDDPFSKKKVGDTVLPHIERIENPIVQSHYMKKLADFLKVSEESIEFMIRNIRQNKKKKSSFTTQVSIKPESESREVVIQKYILSVILQSSDPGAETKKIFAIITPDDFSHPALRKISTLLIESDSKLKEVAPELQPILDELYLYATLELGLNEKTTERLAYELRKLALKRQIETFLTAPSGDDGEPEKIKKIGNQLKEVEKKLATV